MMVSVVEQLERASKLQSQYEVKTPGLARLRAIVRDTGLQVKMMKVQLTFGSQGDELDGEAEEQGGHSHSRPKQPPDCVLSKSLILKCSVPVDFLVPNGQRVPDWLKVDWGDLGNGDGVFRALENGRVGVV